MEKAIPQSTRCCGDVFLRAAERADCGTGGWSPWWSSGLSLYTAWCRCPGGKEAHLQQWGGQFAELCGCQRCCFQTRRWCSPQCRSRRIWGYWGSFQTSSAVSGKRGADVPSSALHLCEQTMWDPRWCECRGTYKLFTRSTGVLSMLMGVCSLLCLLKSTSSSLVLPMLSERWFSWHYLVRLLASSL